MGRSEIDRSLGISDVEKIRVLRKLASTATDVDSKRLMTELDRLLFSMSTEREFESQALRHALESGKKLIEAIADRLVR